MPEKVFKMDHWNEAVDGVLNAANIQKKITSKYNLEFQQARFRKGFALPKHYHEHNKVDTVLSGKMEMTVYPDHFAEGQTLIMKDGDMLYLPAGTLHKAKVLEEIIFYDTY